MDPLAAWLVVALAQSVNDGFEGAALDPAWERAVYGAPATIALDRVVHHGGAQSLRIDASEPSDAALGREITLAGGRWYCARVSVRTRGVRSAGAPVLATLQIQRPHGEGVLAAGANHGGDGDWSETVVPFLAPADGRVRVALFLAGYGRGTGDVWFDDLSVAPFDPGDVVVKVTRRPLVAAPISPMQYGQFIEYLCDLVPGMWAERLCDGGFEGLSRWGFEYRRDVDSRERPWLPSGATHRAEFVLDRTTKFAGDSSACVRASGDSPCTVGIEQRGLFVEKAKACSFSCWLRSDHAPTTVHVRIHREAEELAAFDLDVDVEWRKASARVVPAATATDATIELTFRGPGTLWLDAASLMPEENVGGWRPDVVQAIRAMQPGVIRFGGSALEIASMGDFEWRDVVGPIERRKTLRAWGGLQPAGAGLEEIVQLIEAVGAQPLICVRVTGRTPQDAADEVQYFNGAPDSPMGRLRAANGRVEPERVPLWQIGNELGGAEYEARVADFARAMKAADPTIQLLASYPSEAVVQRAGEWIDFVAPHDYGCADLVARRGEFDALRGLLARAPRDRDLHVAVTEWNTTAGDVGPHRAMLWTLANALACARYHNLLHRNADLVTIANRSNLANSFCSGVLQTDASRLYVTPTYHAQRLYATLAGTTPLALESELPCDLAPDVSATLSSDGRTLALFGVNDAGAAVERTLDFGEFAAPGGAAHRNSFDLRVVTLADGDAAGEPDATNSFERPDRVAPVERRVHLDGTRVRATFPAYSLTVWGVDVAR